MSQNLGLNRNCDSWNLSNDEKEERKRVFYCCYVVDRLTCAMHGRAPTVDDRDMDTPYPSEVDDDDKDNKPTKMEEFHYFIKLCEILGDILQQLYMVKGRKQLAQMSSPDNVISKLDHALNKWMAKLPPYLQYRPPNTRMAETAPAPRLEICQIHMLFYTSLILLHRPFIPGPTQKGTLSVFPSASICTFAANKILDIVECLMAEGRLKNINNYSLYYMFTAGIIFINDALSSDTMFAFEAKISINKIIRAMDEVEKTWITSARHCNILAELAGLRDINLDNIDEAHYKKSASAITMPNSPVEHPIDIGRASNKLPDYLAQQFSPYTTSAQSTPNINNPAPNINMNNNQEPFDPIGTAFWGVPMSFDIDEWNSYLGEQQQNTSTYPQQTNYNPQNMW